MIDDFLIWLDKLRAKATEQRQRKLVVLAGDNHWALNLLSSIPSWPLFNDKQSQQVISHWQVYSDNDALIGTVNRQTYQFKLGSENQYVLFFINNLLLIIYLQINSILMPSLLFLEPSLRAGFVLL